MRAGSAHLDGKVAPEHMLGDLPLLGRRRDLALASAEVREGVRLLRVGG